MSTLLPKDDNNSPIPALRFRNDAEGAPLAHERSGDATDVATVIEFDPETEVISIETAGKIKIAFGTDENVEADADSHGFMGGHYEFIPITNPVEGEQHFTHLSIYFVEDDGLVYVSERN